MAKSPEEMAASMIASLKEKTGKTLSQWSAVLASIKDTKHSELVKHLKQEHGITHGYANLIAHKVLDSACFPSNLNTGLKFVIILQYNPPVFL